MLLDVDVEYTVCLLRCVLVESTRVQNHLLNVGCHAGDVGCLIALLLLPAGQDGNIICRLIVFMLSERLLTARHPTRSAVLLAVVAGGVLQ